jgi:hypothetical protein
MSPQHALAAVAIVFNVSTFIKNAQSVRRTLNLMITTGNYGVAEFVVTIYRPHQ